MGEKSQWERILEALQRGDKLTPMDALKRFGTFRLSGRILELRRQGYPVKTAIIETEGGAMVARYSL